MKIRIEQNELLELLTKTFGVETSGAVIKNGHFYQLNPNL